MPVLNLITNVKIADPKAFVLAFSKFGADTLGKPEPYISAILTYNELLAYGGSFEPSINLRIESLDNLSEELNEGYSKAFFKFFEEKLGTKHDRGVITFVDPGRAYMANSSTTFATIFREK